MSLDSILRSTGKNLLNSDNISLGQFCTVVSKGNGGAVITSPNNEENTATIAYLLNRVKLPAGTYTFSCNFTVENTKNTTRPNEIMTFVDRTFKQTWNLAKSDGTYAPIITFTIDKESEISISWYFNVGAYTTADTTAKVTFSDLQLEKGSTSTSYEPYQQGPKSIKIPYKGNNIITYPYENTTQNINGVTFTVGKDGGITINGTPTDTTKFDVKNSITLEQNKQYTLSGFKERPEGSAGAVFHLDPIGGMSQNITIDSQYQTQTFTADSSNYYCYIIVPTTGDLVDNIVFYPQLEEGTVATEFSLNTGDKEVLKVSYGSRNLWQNTNTTFPAALSYNSTNQTYTLGTGTAGYNFAAHTLTDPIPVGTTVTISIMFQSGKGKSVTIGGYHRTGGRSWQGHINVPLNVDMTGQTLTSTFTTTETVEEFQIFHNTGDNIEEPIVFQVQYELGDKATEYVPYSKEVVWTK